MPLCTTHRQYRAIRRPTVNCPHCWEAYWRIHGFPNGKNYHLHEGRLYIGHDFPEGGLDVVAWLLQQSNTPGCEPLYALAMYIKHLRMQIDTLEDELRDEWD